MKILAIETSCDDTCIAIVEAGEKKRVTFNILSNIISSQVEIHKKWGGIYPYLAKREHQKNLPIVLKKALKKAKNPKINLIAVTVGPGLEPCLWVGVNFAKELAKKMRLPIVPVNHIEAHIFANFTNEQLFPAICLVVSGGHTQLILMKDFGKYKILGETRDDAAGECLDKVAKILGLGYPGGPAVAAESAKFSNSQFSINLPRPMIHQKNYDFSFSGLKTAVLYHFRSQKPKIRTSKNYIKEMSIEVQQAIVDVLINKTIRAAREYKAKTVILGGGVAANNELRKAFKKTIQEKLPKTKYLVPDVKYCTDNAVMVATTAYHYWLSAKVKRWRRIKVDANLRLS